MRSLVRVSEEIMGSMQTPSMCPYEGAFRRDGLATCSVYVHFRERIPK